MLLPFAVQAQAPKAPTHASDSLVVGGDFSYPPYEFIDDNGDPAGFNVDLLRAIAKQQDLDLVFQLGPWDDRLRQLEAGQVSILPMFVSQPRQSDFSFSKPFVHVSHALFVRRGESLSPQSISDLADLRVLVEEGSYAHDALRRASPGLSLVAVPSEHAAMQLLAAGRYDVAVLGALRGRLMLEQSRFSDVTTSGPPLLPASYAFAVARGNEELLRRIDHGLQQVKASGQFDRLYNKWLAQAPGAFHWNQLASLLAWAALVLAAVALVVALWIYALKRKVASQTRALRSSEEQIRATFENAGVGIASLNPGLRWHRANAAFAAMLGTRPERLNSKSLRHILNRADARRLLGELRRIRAGRSEHFSAECGFTGHDGRAGWARIMVTTLRHGDDTTRAFIVVAENLTRTRQLETQLVYQSNHDALTGLKNRRALSLKLNALMRPGAAGREHALCYLDLDQFKVVNDTCGHAAGDALLKLLASRLGRFAGEHSMLAHLGGDEFGLLMEDGKLEDAFERANGMRDVIANLDFSWHDYKFKLAASIGIVQFNNQISLPGGVLGAADIACSAAKDNGGNQIHVFVIEDREMIRRHGEIRWASRLSAAMDHNQFELHYQPIVALRGDNPTRHCELLLRYRDPQGHLVHPDRFIPAAERYLMMEALDRWVVCNALQWLQTHPQLGRQLGTCAINLSGQSIGSPDFHEFLEQALDTYDVPPRRICIEITETTAIANIGVASEFTRRLKRRGCQLALDDFGIGMSSFAYLKSFPVDYLKIDGSFVREIGNNRVDRAVVRAIAEIGQALGMKTVAEFVETAEILQHVNDIGLDYGQGFHFDRPRPLSDLLH